MDFSTGTATPVTITINGKSYNLPRFLLPQMKEYTAERTKAHADAATAHFDPDTKARFLIYFQPVPIDVFDMAKWARSADGGAMEIFDRQMKAAGVPDEDRAAVIANSDPVAVAKVAEDLASSKQASAGAKNMTEDNESPLAGQPGASQDSPGAGATVSQSSTTATAD